MLNILQKLESHQRWWQILSLTSFRIEIINIMQGSVTSIFMSVELRQTFAFIYLLRRINPLHICLVSSAVMLGIIFVLRGHESKYLCSDFVKTGKDLGRPTENPARQTLTERCILFSFSCRSLKWVHFYVYIFIDKLSEHRLICIACIAFFSKWVK